METGAASYPIVCTVDNDVEPPDSAITTALIFFLYYIFQCHSNIKWYFPVLHSQEGTTFICSFSI
jgi:hypothetical protein